MSELYDYLGVVAGHVPILARFLLTRRARDVDEETYSPECFLFAQGLLLPRTIGA